MDGLVDALVVESGLESVIGIQFYSSAHVLVVETGLESEFQSSVPNVLMVESGLGRYHSIISTTSKTIEIVWEIFFCVKFQRVFRVEEEPRPKTLPLIV